MDRILRYATYLACIAQLVFVLLLIPQLRGTDVFALLLAVPPVLAMIALYCGPDAEERRLTRQLSKARLRQELAAMSGRMAKKG